MQTKDYLDVRDLAARFGASWRTVLRWADSGRIPAGLKLGGLRRWPRASIEAWERDGCQPVRAARGATR